MTETGRTLLSIIVLGLMIMTMFLTELTILALRPRHEWTVRIAVALAALLGLWYSIDFVYARDLDGRYAASPLKPWFDSLRSGKGPCCSDADGYALSDVDWETQNKDGSHYRVRVENKWWDVPDEAVITEPNRAGRTMVWPIMYNALGGGIDKIEIRCFMPGQMS